jgi:hypothetical protein
MMRQDYVSILRTVEKMISFYQLLEECNDANQIVLSLKRLQYETVYKQANYFKAC